MTDIDPKCHGLDKQQLSSFNDDRFGRALDKLYAADRATLMTEIVVTMIKKINLDTGRVHNDSTTVKAYGKISGVTKDGLRMAKGKGKDHRSDLVHLVFSLTISSDGAVPVHYKTYAGNRTDGTIHIETWNTVKKIAGRSDFIYVADSKVCTLCQLTHIVSNGGRVITVMPNTWGETKIFKDELLSTNIPRKVILKRNVEEGDCDNEYFSLFSGNYKTINYGYAIYWYLSSQKKGLDKAIRQKRVSRAESALMELSLKLNKRDLKTEEKIREQVEAILNKYGLRDFFKINISTSTEKIRVKIGKGRPGPFAEYRSASKTIYALDWEIDSKRLKRKGGLTVYSPFFLPTGQLAQKKPLSHTNISPGLRSALISLKVFMRLPLFFLRISKGWRQ